MSTKKLIALIKNYKDNVAIEVDIYFKNGQKNQLSDITITSKAFLTQNESFPFNMLSHAEIYSK